MFEASARQQSFAHLERPLFKQTALVIVPIFGFANAGVS